MRPLPKASFLRIELFGADQPIQSLILRLWIDTRYNFGLLGIEASLAKRASVQPVSSRVPAFYFALAHASGWDLALSPAAFTAVTA